MTQAPWKRVLRSLLLAVALACFAAWGMLVARIIQHRVPSMAGLPFWLTGLLLAGWAALFAALSLRSGR